MLSVEACICCPFSLLVPRLRYQASRDDLAVYSALKSPPSETDYPHAARWYQHIKALLGVRCAAGRRRWLARTQQAARVAGCAAGNMLMVASAHP